MKIFLRQFLKYYFKLIVKLYLIWQRPVVIAVSGSTNKTFAREGIFNKLAEEGIDVFTHSKSFNTEIGMPLSVLGLSSGYNSYLDWMPIILQAPLQIFRKKPKYLVLEYGVSDPGDMKYLFSIVRPDIGIITDISQRYLERFYDLKNLAMEYDYFCKNIKEFLVYNKDNSQINNIVEPLKGKVNLKSVSILSESDRQAIEIKKHEFGQSYSIAHPFTRCEVDRFGIHHIFVDMISNIVLEYVKKE